MKRFATLTFTALCVTVAAVVVAAILLPAALGLQRYVITGASMTGTIDRGSIVYARLAPVRALEVGDIITFAPPGQAKPITHRIVSITVKEGQRLFNTKGDFNQAVDPWTITFPQPRLAKYAYHIPYLGYFLGLLSVRSVRMGLIGLPALVIAISLLWSLWKSAGEEVRAEKTARAAVQQTSALVDVE
jgi:signal peptidase I